MIKFLANLVIKIKAEVAKLESEAKAEEVKLAAALKVEIAKLEAEAVSEEEHVVSEVKEYALSLVARLKKLL
jgi:hypothetical protein